jgi:hypothetical protein
MRPDQASHRVRDARCIDASQMPVSNGPFPILASPPLTTPDDFALCKADPRQNCGNNGSPDERRAGDVIGSRLGAWRAAEIRRDTRMSSSERALRREEE